MDVTFENLLEMNRRATEKGLAYKIHLSDACGGQTLWIESLQENDAYDNLDDLVQIIKDFFAEHRAEVEFGKDQKTFWSSARY